MLLTLGFDRLGLIILFLVFLAGHHRIGATVVLNSVDSGNGGKADHIKDTDSFQTAQMQTGEHGSGSGQKGHRLPLPPGIHKLPMPPSTPPPPSPPPRAHRLPRPPSTPPPSPVPRRKGPSLSCQSNPYSASCSAQRGPHRSPGQPYNGPSIHFPAPPPRRTRPPVRGPIGPFPSHAPLCPDKLPQSNANSDVTYEDGVRVIRAYNSDECVNKHKVWVTRDGATFTGIQGRCLTASMHVAFATVHENDARHTTRTAGRLHCLCPVDMICDEQVAHVAPVDEVPYESHYVTCKRNEKKAVTKCTGDQPANIVSLGNLNLNGRSAGAVCSMYDIHGFQTTGYSYSGSKTKTASMYMTVSDNTQWKQIIQGKVGGAVKVLLDNTRKGLTITCHRLGEFSVLMMASVILNPSKGFGGNSLVQTIDESKQSESLDQVKSSSPKMAPSIETLAMPTEIITV